MMLQIVSAISRERREITYGKQQREGLFHRRFGLWNSWHCGQLHSLIPGEERLLRAAVQPWSVTDRSLTWTSSNPAVASVDADGNITAHRNGQAVITATSTTDASKAASCSVTVEAPQVQLHGAVQTASGETRLFTWDMRQGDRWSAGRGDGEEERR